jgi:hypothetical protein
MPAGPEQRHADRREPLLSRRGIGLYHAVPWSARRPDEHGVIPVSLARGNRQKTRAECARCGCLAGESQQPPRRSVAPWAIALGVDAGAAHAAAARGQLGMAASRACMHLVARLGHAQRRDRTDDDRCLVLAAGRLGRMLESVSRTASPEAMTTAASRSGRRTLSLRCKRTRGQANCSITAVIKTIYE